MNNKLFALEKMGDVTQVQFSKFSSFLTSKIFYTTQYKLKTPTSQKWHLIITLVSADKITVKSWTPQDFNELSVFDNTKPAILFNFFHSTWTINALTAIFKDPTKVKNWFLRLTDNTQNGDSPINVILDSSGTETPLFESMLDDGTKTFLWNWPPYGSHSTDITKFNVFSPLLLKKPDSSQIIQGNSFFCDFPTTNGSITINGTYLGASDEPNHPIVFQNGVLSKRMHPVSSNRLSSSQSNDFSNDLNIHINCIGEETGVNQLNYKPYPIGRNPINNPYHNGWDWNSDKDNDGSNWESAFTYQSPLEVTYGKNKKAFIEVVKPVSDDDASDYITRVIYLGKDSSDADSWLSNFSNDVRPQFFLFEPVQEDSGGTLMDNRIKTMMLFFKKNQSGIADKLKDANWYAQLLSCLDKKELISENNGSSYPLLSANYQELSPNNLLIWIDDIEKPTASLTLTDSTKLTILSAGKNSSGYGNPSLKPENILRNVIATRGVVNYRTLDDYNQGNTTAHSLKLIAAFQSILDLPNGLQWQIAHCIPYNVPPQGSGLDYFGVGNNSHIPFQRVVSPNIYSSGTDNYGRLIKGDKVLDLPNYRFCIQLANQKKPANRKGLPLNFTAGNPYLTPVNPKDATQTATGSPNLVDFFRAFGWDNATLKSTEAVLNNITFQHAKTEIQSPIRLTNNAATANQFPIALKFNPLSGVTGGVFDVAEISLINPLFNPTIQKIGNEYIETAIDIKGKRIEKKIQQKDAKAQPKQALLPNLISYYDLLPYQVLSLSILEKKEGGVTHFEANDLHSPYKFNGDTWVTNGLFAPEAMYLSDQATLEITDTDITKSPYLSAEINVKDTETAPYGYWSQARGMTFFTTDGKDGVGDFVWARLGPIDQSFPVLPMLFYANATKKGTESWEEIENLTLAKARWQANNWALPRYLAKKQAKGPAFMQGVGTGTIKAIDSTTVLRTPDGMLFTVGTNGSGYINNWELATGLSFDFSKGSDTVLAIMLQGLAYNNALMVMQGGKQGNAISTTFTKHSLNVPIGEEIFAFDWNLASKESAMVIKLATGETMRSMLGTTDNWLCPDVLIADNNTSAVQATITDTLKKAPAKNCPPQYSDLQIILDDPDWTGVVMFNCPLNYGQLSPDIQMILGGISGTLRAEFAFIDQNTISGHQITESSVCALVAYD